MVECRLAFTGCPTPMQARWLQSHREKARGLLGAGASSGAVVLASCRSIHTFGMCVPLDVAFVDCAGRVVRSIRGLPPGRIRASRDAWLVLERPAAPDPWPQEGDFLTATLFEGTQIGGIYVH